MTADGFLVACLHGDFETSRGVFRVHAHGVAAGGLIPVVEALRDLHDFDVAHDPPSGLKKPPPRLEISRTPISNLAYTISYQFKSYWLSTWIGPVGDGDLVKRARRGQRIHRPHHAELLIWFDQHELQDITLLMKLRVGKQGFVLTHPKQSKT